MSLPLVFAGVMGAAILAYVLLDGFDLGVGMLMPAAGEREQDVMVSAIGPFWDANETWLVLGIGILLVAFPVAHGYILGALYLPVAAMLIGLMLRGAAFEFRVKAQGWHRRLWSRLFWLGSLVAAFSQGVMLAQYVTGFAPMRAGVAFSVLVGAGLCGGYVLLGATWLIAKTEDALQRKAATWARAGLVATAIAVAAVGVVTPLVSEPVRARWLAPGSAAPLLLLPVASVAAWAFTWSAIGRTLSSGRSEWRPFAGAAALFTLAFAGLAYSLFPDVVVGKMTIWDAAAHPSALEALLVGTVIVLPFVAGYTVFAYRVFRGKAPASLYD